MKSSTPFKRFVAEDERRYFEFLREVGIGDGETGRYESEGFVEDENLVEDCEDSEDQGTHGECLLDESFRIAPRF